MLTLYRFDGKSKEEALNKCFDELNLTEKELFLQDEKEECKLFKSKKYIINCYKTSDIGEYIKNYINNISEIMNIETKTEIREEEGIFNVMLVSNSNSILIGKDGKTLKSIEILIKQSILSKTKLNIKINLDVSGYKQKKLKRLKYEIKTIAKEVLKTKIEAKLDCMNSYERRVVHTIISDYQNLYTESIGVEPNRYVVIKYKEN